MMQHFIAGTKERNRFEKHIPAPLFRKAFFLDFAPTAATFRIAAAGFYVLTVNGKDITKGALSPYLSNPDHYVYYDTYDLLPYLVKGKNVVGVLLGNGLQNNIGGAVWDFHIAPWIGVPSISFDFCASGNGGHLFFTSDETVKVYPSPITFDDYRLGEHYDARLLIDGWDMPAFDDSAWDTAIPVKPPRGALRTASIAPICVYAEREPISIISAEDGSYIYDFGINSAGVLHLSIEATAGQRIKIDHFERLLDGKFDQENLIFRIPHHDFYFEGYMQSVTYTARGGGVEEYMPTFAYFGFRYARVTGITEKQATKSLLTYRLMSSATEEIAALSTSDQALNRIVDMALNTVKANYYHHFTDCPHREKMGWTGDGAASMPYTMLFFDLERNYEEWMRGIRAAQQENGEIPGVVPTGTWGYQYYIGPTWARIITEIPYQLYRYCGNTDCIRESADTILRYLRYVMTLRDGDGVLRFGLGDWCPPGTCPTRYDVTASLAVTDTLSAIDIAKTAGMLFRIVGMDEAAAYVDGVYKELRTAFRNSLCDLSEMTVVGREDDDGVHLTQTGQAYAISCGMFDDSELPLAYQRLVEKIHADGDHFTCGYTGLRVLFDVLTACGESELAYKLIMQDEFPSYKFLLSKDLTALPEFFDLDENLVGSHCHPVFGSVVHWLMKVVGGIEIVSPNRIRVSPVFIKTLDFSNAHYDTKWGRVTVAWKRENDKLFLSVSHPAEVTVDISVSAECNLEDTIID